MEFDPRISGWQLLSSSYYGEESNIELFQLFIQIKKAVFTELRRRKTVIDKLDPDIRRIHTKITSVYYHFPKIREFKEQLFCTSKILK